MGKNYYVILGISRDASPRQIKGAYRRRARELHPDYYGEDDEPFKEIQEAYAVLGDTARRRAYDRQLERRRVFRPTPVEASPRRADGPAPEPLIPEERPEDLGRISLARSFHTYSPSFDEIFDWLWRNFDTLAPPKSGTMRNLDVRVPITPDQARSGGHARITVPARMVCPTCRGQGGIGAYECWRCAGEGAMSGEVPLSIAFPPGVPGAHVVHVPLDRFGIRNMVLSVHFEVSDEID